MNEPRPKTEQPKEQMSRPDQPKEQISRPDQPKEQITRPDQRKEQIAPNAVVEPSTTAVPTKPIVASPLPKSPDSGGNTPQVANPKDPARAATQARP